MVSTILTKCRRPMIFSVRYFSLNGKVVVITGASSGIGEELGLLYAKSGANLVLAARRVDKLESVTSRCLSSIKEKGFNSTVIPLSCDVSKESDCKQLVDATIAKFGKLDMLILNAGVGQSFFMEATSETFDIRQFMDINYYGCVYPTMFGLPYLHKTGGRIVVVSSLGGLMPFPRQTFYNATKYALVGFFDTLRLEIQGKGTGVSISMICPGFVQTEITAGGGLGRDGKPIGKSMGGSYKMITAAQCATEIAEAAEARQRLLITPKMYKPLIWIRKFFPELIDSYLTKQFVPKSGDKKA